MDPKHNLQRLGLSLGMGVGGVGRLVPGTLNISKPRGAVTQLGPPSLRTPFPNICTEGGDPCSAVSPKRQKPGSQLLTVPLTMGNLGSRAS